VSADQSNRQHCGLTWAHTTIKFSANDNTLSLRRPEVDATHATPRPKLHYLNLLWICCTACCTTNPQQIELMEIEPLSLCSALVSVDQRSCSASGPVSTAVDDCFRAGETISAQYVISDWGRNSAEYNSLPLCRCRI